tara:strand:+ start:1218 stop:1496 length:279 start_codon:yes stop_codon:yes gene_type:complete
LHIAQLVHLADTWQNDELSISSAPVDHSDFPALIARVITVDGSTELVQGGTVDGRLFGRFPGLLTAEHSLDDLPLRLQPNRAIGALTQKFCG